MGPIGWTLLALALIALGFALAKIRSLSKQIAASSDQRFPVAISSPQDLAGDNAIRPQAPIATSLMAPDGRSLMSVALLDVPTFQSAQSLTLPSLDIDRLSPLVQLAPDIATASKVASSNLYHVVISGDMIAAKGIPDALRPMTQGPDGRYTELATLYKTESLQSLVSSGLVLNVASMALAQKHLADINNKLEALQSGLNSVAWFQNAERRASIEGAIAYFKEISGPMMSGELPITYQQQIENHYAALGATQIFLLADIKRREKEIARLKDGGQWGSEVFRTAITKEATDLEEVMEQWCLTTRARQQAWCLQALVPGNPESKQARLEEIQASIEEMRDASGPLSKALSALNSKVDEINSKVELAQTLSHHRKSMREALANRGTALWQAVDDTAQMVSAASKISDDAAAPLHLAVRVESGRVVEARAIPHEAQDLGSRAADA